ncbi:MAG TPA: protein translocase subunit SecD [Tepidisphaeraceae bacterium]|jgi:SecD/SecF fusion protein|nr:protein translocase subunit SecD [Tepidisphaeraceae bacterium]
MPTNYSSRITLIVSIIVLCLLAIFWGPPSRLFNPHLTPIQKTDLRPGIDMVGGVSLVYSIQSSGSNDPDLSEHVMEALKKRVDPLGLRNLVWRPQGADRIEIEMPLSPEAMEAPQIKKAFDDAQRELDATNVRVDEVLNAVEHTKGAQREQRLAELASGSKTRAELFKDLGETYDEIQTLRGNPQKLSLPMLAAKLQPLTVQYEDMKSRIDQTNLAPADFQPILDQVNSDDPDQAKAGQAKLDELKRTFAGFPARLKAMEDFQAKYKDYDSVKNAITGADDLKRLLQGSGVLEFHILADDVTSNSADLKAMDARLAPGGKGPLPQPGDTIRWMAVDKPEEFDRPGSPPETREWNGKHYMPVLTEADASMTKDSGKWGLENARSEGMPDGSRAVGFNFDTTGGVLFGELTTNWYNKARQHTDIADPHARLAIVLDNKIISAPNINSPITGGSGIITGGGKGGFSTADLNYLINTLNAGSLPAQLSDEPISQQQVGPTLGADNLYRGLLACGFGLIVVAVFLVSYYYVAGMVAFVAVLMNLVLTLGVMCALNATFTLPSIAGIVLSIGTAVDANVLIFERLREEQHKNLPLRMALRNSYAQAQSAIIDSNMTSIITSLCLYAFGSEEVKGFGLTLIIGIGASLFTALYVTKTIFGIMIDKFGMKHLGSLPLTFPAWDRLLKPKIDWMGLAWIFYTFSAIMLISGMTLFVIKVRQGRMMDIEFATGTSLQFQLKHPMEQDDVRKLIEAQSVKDPRALPSPSVVAVGTDQLHYQVVVPNDKRDQVRSAVLEAMNGKLRLQLPSDFGGASAEYRDAADKEVFPITRTFSVDGYTPPAAASHPGGVAIVLRNISPPLSVEEIGKRLDNQRLSSSSNTTGSVQYVVQSPGDPAKPTSFAVVVGWNPSVSYDADAGKWMDELAQPLWGLVKDAVNHPPSFEQETNFDPQVAGEMQQDAFLALAFSVIAIMIYIWVRFGNLKYGTATVVALLHDTVFTLAALGFAHYISQYWSHNFLQIEPFRINLTVVAGILTIMGYSMIDTIVVFDRIRENRGRYGHLDREVINDAINQTLSRTVLTCGTTIMTVSFMYFLGGAGIHGFTFVLLVGILVGTYSSVAIAAPLLLWGREREPTGVMRAPVGQLPRAKV